MIDLTCTWCEATEENYKALLSLVYTQNINLSQLGKGSFYIKSDNTAYFSSNMGTPNIKYKQIHLIDGQFQYIEETVEENPKNNFKEYGFEADFEGCIFKEGTILSNQKVYLATIKNVNEDLLVYFNEDGKCHQGRGYFIEKYNLKPIKKEWYKNPDNFPCIVISLKTNKPHIAYNYDHLEEKIKQETFSAKPDKFRPATKEEVLSLVVKEELC